jgi:ABC-type multidrug transport system fused ATPase/permease subunit
MNGFVLTLSIGIRHGYNALHDVMNEGQQRAHGAAYLTQILAGIGVICALGSIPRRPDVFVNGQLVDQQFTVPLLWRLSHSWNAIVFQISKERQLQLADIPKLGYKIRSETVHHRFLARKAEGRLWWRLIKAHAWEILEQNVLTLIIAGLVIFPEIALYNFLSRIESRQDYTSTDPVLFVWIFALFISIVLEVILGNLLSWVTSSKLEMPVSSMLQTLVFRKALNQYETTRPPQKEDLEALRNPQVTAGAKDGKKGQKDSKAGKKDKGQGPDVSQSVINHMKLDSNRITMFCTFANSFPSAFFKLILAGTFLIQLIGWKAFFGGLFAAGLMIPVSTYMSGKFRDIQFGLMRYRDGKAHILEEALQGMRQIKYSALEQLWQNKILKARNEELAQFWKASLLICVLMFIINLGPLLLACVSLSIYAWENGSNIRASVIFTSLGLFQMVDEAVAMLPVLQTFMMEAWTSCTRLEKYLKQADKPQVATPGEFIAMEKATVAWPKTQDLDAKEDEQPDPRSILSDITVEFPSGKLSIITGKTGSGKSLLLAAILGEVKLISGKITFPEAAELPIGIGDEFIPHSGWTIPALSAYVSQSPWIEGGTVRENIVFGLPFVQSRYDAAIHACALEKDIETLVEGEDTEVGPKGVQLSGGQRWRLALARALYSRAGIIVMDDVLSAVDAHVGRRIVEEALAGPLAEGRTRILATHHAELCLPHASYLIRLHDLRLESAETLQASHRPAMDMSEEGARASAPEGNGHAPSGNGQSGVNGKNGKTGAAKDKDDMKEKREVGRVKWRVYKIYLGASGGFLLWTLGISILIAVQLASVARTWSLKELSETAPMETVNTSALSFLHVKEQHAFLPAYDYTAKYEKRSTAFWMSVYVGLYLLSSIISIGRTLSFFAIGLTAAKVLFERMTHAVLRAPLRWIDTVPSGRILNRFTTDTFTLDRRTVEPLSGFLRSIMALIIVIGASLSVSIYVILFGIFLSFFYIYVANRFIVTARELKRINSVSHSPIYDQFSSVLNGLSTIRAYHRTKLYMNRMFGLIDDATKASYALNVCNLWMGFRLGMLGAAFVTFVATAVALLRIDAALAGFSLTFAFGYTSALRALLSA